MVYTQVNLNELFILLTNEPKYFLLDEGLTVRTYKSERRCLFTRPS